MLKAAVGHPKSIDRDTRCSALLPRLWHWAAFPEFVPLAELGEDGHPKLGRFLPPLAFKRRMWAAGRLSFPARSASASGCAGHRSSRR
jgi:3-methylfumaryl-CoA hydratase